MRQYYQNLPTRTESPAKQAIRKWIAQNYGAISKVAREFKVSPHHAHEVAFNRRISKDLRIERALKSMGCPLIRKIG